MMVTHASTAAPLWPVTPAAQARPAHPTVVDVARENRLHERTEALASVPAFNVAFNIDVGSNAIIVMMSDRVSGEIFRKLVYDQSGMLQPQAAGAAGQLIDLVA